MNRIIKAVVGIVAVCGVCQQAHAEIVVHDVYTFRNVVDLRSTIKISGTSMTATATELNVVDLTTLGTSQDSKAATYSATGKHTVAAADTIDFTGVLAIGGTRVTSAAAELNYVDITTLGTSQDSKALTSSATGKTTIAAADTIDFNTGALAIAGTVVSSSAAELNYSDITTLGTSQDSKVLTLSATGKATVSNADTINFTTGTGLQIAGTSVSSSAAEINYSDITTLGNSEDSKVLTASGTGKTTIVSGDTIDFATGAVVAIAGTVVSSSAAELNYVDITTLGTSADSKAATYSGTGKHTVADGDTINFTTGTGLQIGGTSVTASAAELNYVDITTLGTSADSKAATYSATGKHTVADGDTINFTTGTGLQIAGTSITASATEVNLTDGLVTVYGAFTIGLKLDSVTVTGLASPREIISLWSINTDSAYGLTCRMAGTNTLQVQRPGADVYTAEADSFGVTYCPNIN